MGSSQDGIGLKREEENRYTSSGLQWGFLKLELGILEYLGIGAKAPSGYAAGQ